MLLELSWTEFKAFVAARAMAMQFYDAGGQYRVFAFDGPICYACNVMQDAGSDQTDFEANYKSSANAKIGEQKDSDNAVLSRVKAAPTGWTFQFRCFDFTTALPASLNNSDNTGADLGDVNMKFYKANGTQVTSPGVLDVDQLAITKTVVDFEPAYDYYIIGGHSKSPITPVSDCRLFVVAVPDIPAPYGGSKVMVNNANFRLITGNDKIDTDGRAAKLLSYSATYHTNKLRFIFNHAAGEQIGFIVAIEHYKM